MSDPLRKRLLERGPDGKPTFTYVSHAETNVAATLARIRAELAEVRPANVRQLKKAGK